MSKEFSSIDDSLREFIAEQAMFFVATAPSEGGRINLSPKGYADTFAVLDDHTVAYLDLFGSGVETIAHLRDNGRITLMFCSFTRNSRILRLFGTGRVVRPDEDEFARVQTHFGDGHAGIRAAIVVDVERIADACGFAVPYYELVGERRAGYLPRQATSGNVRTGGQPQSAQHRRAGRVGPGPPAAAARPVAR